MEGTPKVSVIIPVYNTENYLRECLNSVVNQTLRDIEIICVNDGSTDGSLDILREYAKKDARFTVTSQKNGGQSSARNRGLELAKGAYVYFLDSDDYIKESALERLYAVSEQEKLDILFFGADSFFESNELRDQHHSYHEYYHRQKITDGAVTGGRLSQLFFEKNLFRCSVPLQFFNQEFLVKTGVTFFEGIVHEDELFSPLVLLQAARAMCITDILYMRRVRGSSTMTARVSKRNFDGQFITFANLLSVYIQTDWSKNEGGESLFARVKSLYNASKTTYRSLSEGERKELLKDTEAGYRFLFHELNYPGLVAVDQVLKQVKAPETKKDRDSEVQILKKKVLQLDKEIHAIHSSATYRIGRVITFIPRKVRGGIRCYQEHGFRYTFRRFFEHLGIDVNDVERRREEKRKVKAVRKLLARGGTAVSVIMPVYNAEAYLKKCIDSILEQSFPIFELICVDDGSKDRSLEILREYERRDSRVKVLTQANQYAGVARNAGMRIAQGEYLLFVDADDFIDRDLILHAYADAKRADADVVIFGADIYDHQKKTFSPASWLVAQKFLPLEPVFNAQDIPDHIFAVTTGGPCNKLFRRKLIEEQQLQFPPFRSSNDLGFVYPAIALAKRIITINLPLYHIRRAHGTNLSATRDVAPKVFFNAYEGLKKTLQEKGVYQLTERSFANRALGGCMWEIANLKNEQARREAEKLLLDHYQYVFGIAGRPADYFYYTDWYKKYQLLLKTYSEGQEE